MTTKQLLWRQRIELWCQSRLSVRDCCQRHRLSEQSFYFCRRTLKATSPHKQAVAPPAFARVTLIAPTPDLAPAPAPIELLLANGPVVRLPRGFDPDTLRQLLVVIEEVPSC